MSINQINANITAGEQMRRSTLRNQRIATGVGVVGLTLLVVSIVASVGAALVGVGVHGSCVNSIQHSLGFMGHVAPFIGVGLGAFALGVAAGMRKKLQKRLEELHEDLNKEVKSKRAQLLYEMSKCKRQIEACDEGIKEVSQKLRTLERSSGQSTPVSSGRSTPISSEEASSEGDSEVEAHSERSGIECKDLHNESLHLRDQLEEHVSRKVMFSERLANYEQQFLLADPAHTVCGGGEDGLSPTERSQQYVISGQLELPPGQKILFVNGIMNTKKDAQASAQKISELSGGYTVHYLHNATAGFKQDVSEVYQNIKGKVTPPVRLLIGQIAEHFHDHPDGHLMLVAHSQGAAIVKAAWEHLPDNIPKDQITIVGIGPAATIKHERAVYYKQRVDRVLEMRDIASRLANRTSADPKAINVIPGGKFSEAGARHSFNHPEHALPLKTHLEMCIATNGKYKPQETFGYLSKK